MSMTIPYLKEHYGDLASVIGLLVTFFGFVATIRGVGKAKRAAEEAQKSAREAVLRLRSQILVDEIDVGIKLIGSIASDCRETRWKEAMEGSIEASTLLSLIQEHQALLPSEKEAVNRAVEDLGKLTPHIQSIRRKNLNIDISNQKTNQLHQIIIALGKLQGRLRNEPLEGI